MYHYDVEGRLIAESNQKGEVLKEYLWLDGELIAAAESGELFFAHRDYRNQPCLVTDKDGLVIWKAVSSPFGAARVLSPSRPDFGKIAETPNQNTETIGSFTLNLRLPGQYFDAETGYHYNGFRDYSPELGRYLQADPIGLNGGMNLYAYCGGDPVNKADPMGLADPGADIGDGRVDETESIDDGWGDDDYQEAIDEFVRQSYRSKHLKDQWEVDPRYANLPLEEYRRARNKVQIVSSDAFGIPGLNHVGVYDPWSGKYFGGTDGSSGVPTAGVSEAPDFVAKSPKTDVDTSALGMTGQEVVDSLSQLSHIFNEGVYGIDINFEFDSKTGLPSITARRNICHDQLAAGFEQLGLEYPETAKGVVDFDDWLYEVINQGYRSILGSYGIDPDEY